MLSQFVTFALLFILVADFVLFIACLAVGPRLRQLCRVALWVNGILLALQLGLTALILFQVKPEQRSLAVLAGSAGVVPPLLALVAFAAIYRWRMKPRTSPPPLPC